MPFTDDIYTLYTPGFRHIQQSLVQFRMYFIIKLEYESDICQRKEKNRKEETRKEDKRNNKRDKEKKHAFIPNGYRTTPSPPNSKLHIFVIAPSPMES